MKVMRTSFRSRKPAARKFKRWVIHQVIPAIRKTVGYLHVTEKMSDLEILAKANLIAPKYIQQLHKQVTDMTYGFDIKPIAVFDDAPRLGVHFVHV